MYLSMEAPSSLVTTTAVALAVAEAAGASEWLPYLDLNEEMTSARMLWGLPFSLGGARIEELALAADSGAAVTVVFESLICRSLRLESCNNASLLSAVCNESSAVRR